MPQEQRTVELRFLNGRIEEAVATGNNAAWNCACGRNQPLIGRTGVQRGASKRTTVECPDCCRRYFVVPDGGDYKRTLVVEEIEAPAP